MKIKMTFVTDVDDFKAQCLKEVTQQFLNDDSVRLNSTETVRYNENYTHVITTIARNLLVVLNGSDEPEENYPGAFSIVDTEDNKVICFNDTYNELN